MVRGASGCALRHHSRAGAVPRRHRNAVVIPVGRLRRLSHQRFGWPRHLASHKQPPLLASPPDADFGVAGVERLLPRHLAIWSILHAAICLASQCAVRWRGRKAASPGGDRLWFASADRAVAILRRSRLAFRRVANAVGGPKVTGARRLASATLLAIGGAECAVQFGTICRQRRLSERCRRENVRSLMPSTAHFRAWNLRHETLHWVVRIVGSVKSSFFALSLLRPAWELAQTLAPTELVVSIRH